MGQQKSGGLGAVVQAVSQTLLSALAEKDPVRQKETPGPLVLSGTRSVVVLLATVWAQDALQRGIDMPRALMGIALALALPIMKALERTGVDAEPDAGGWSPNKVKPDRVPPAVPVEQPLPDAAKVPFPASQEVAF